MVRVALHGCLAWALTTLSPHAAHASDWASAGGALLVGEPAERQPPDEPILAGDQAWPTNAVSEQPFNALVERAAHRHGLDPRLLHALVVVESGYRPDAVSSAGAAGLTQLMPATARELGVTDRHDPAQSLLGGAAYLARQLDTFQDVRLALAAYNAGPGRVRANWRAPEIAETQTFVVRVIDCFLALTIGRPVRSATACASPPPSDLNATLEFEDDGP